MYRTLSFFIAIYISFETPFLLPLQAQTIKFDRLSIDDGLSNSYVTCILQDKKGFMWFGTQDGLNRYDGYYFTVYKHDPSNMNSISDNFVKSMCEDKEGILWIGTESRGFNRFDPTNETFIRYKNEPDNPNSLSDNSVRVIYATHHSGRDILWIGTDGGGLNKFDPATNTFTHYIHDPNDTNSLTDNYVRAIHQDKSGNLWIGTEDGLNKYDPDSGNWTRYHHDPSNPNSLTHSNISTIYEDREGVLWIGTFSGLNRMEAEASTGFEQIVQGYGIQSLCEDKFGKLWIGSYLGVDKFDPDQPGKESFTRYEYDSGDPKSLSGTPVTTIYEDRSGILWFGTGGSGISKLNPSIKNFVHYSHIPGNPNSLSHPSVRGIYEDEDGILWVGGYGGLNRIDRKTGHFENYRRENAKIDELDSDVIYTIIGDPENKDILWIGTEGNGLYKFHKESKKVKRYLEQSRATDRYASNILSDRFVFDLFVDSKGILWIATNGGLNRFERDTEQVTYFNHDPADSNSISGNDTRIVYEDHYGYLWVGTEANGINLFDMKTEQFTRFLHDPENPNSLSNNRIKSIYEDQKGRLWIGTNGGGLNRFDRETKTFKYFTEKDGLPNDVIYGILEDDAGYLWLSTNWGLSKFNPETETFRNYDVNDGLQSNEFNTASYFKSKSGEMFFGGINGFNVFFPDEIQDDLYVPPIVITGFQIGNKPVPIGRMEDKRTILPRHISNTEEIELTYKDYLFSFEFVSLSYAAPRKNKYAYKMEGLDRDWIYTDAKKRFATYTSLPAGHYIFKVKGTNQDGVWNEAGTSIRIVVAPPPWKTWWAYTLYIVIIGTVLYGFTRFEINRERLKSQLKLEHLEAEKLQELDRMKSNFFANISHEFRTPLTLIRGPLEDLSREKYGSLPEAVRTMLSLSLRNARRLQQLIEQLLDLSTLEAGKLTIHARKHDLVHFIERIIDAFSSLIKKLQINLKFKTDSPLIELYFDEEKLEKLMNNLISNALKFTPEGGDVTVTLQDVIPETGERGIGEFVTIEISDTGQGIPPEHLPHIFDRFYQVESSQTLRHEGTGIGLAIVKEFVELHGGEISVESEVGVGTTFTLTLPKGKAHLSEEELVESPQVADEVKHDLVYDEGFTEEETTKGIKLPKDAGTVLIVEDNADMRMYLREHLSPHYHVVEAADGEEGLQKAREILPDLIISDIMMPRMDGILLCRAIRDDDILRNVPVILLSARVGEEDRLKGLETKADDYITKPFSPEELKLRIHNLIDRRQKLWEEFNRKVVAFQSKDLHLDSVDKAFLERTRGAVEKHISDKDFNVEGLAGKVFLGRRQLERRLKDLTGLTPSDFIRQIRLIQAKQLLDERVMSTVAEVAHAVGFSKVEYFSLLFRNTFGQSPSDLIRK